MPWRRTDVMQEKIEFVYRALSRREKFSELCREFTISTKTGYKWVDRFLKKGLAGLAELSRKPLGNAKQVAEDIVCELIRIKFTKKNWGPKKIRQVYINNHPGLPVPALSTVNRILHKAGLQNLRKRKRKAAGERIQTRAVAEAPNDVWTVDFKGWWYTQFKEKCEPLTVRDQYSKYILSIRILKKGDIYSVKQEFLRLFETYGLPRVIRSDNGPPFACAHGILGLTKLAVWWMSLGIQLDRIDPGKPQQNGAHERMHLDMKKELEGKISGSLEMHQKVFDVWREEFNNERPHEALEGKTPASVYRKSDRPYEDFDELRYSKGFYSRRVNDRGYFHYNGRRIFAGNAFNGMVIGLEDRGPEGLRLYLEKFFIGVIDPVTCVLTSRSAKANEVLPMS
jgi:transposase InsO family protein